MGNAVQANLLAAWRRTPPPTTAPHNVACSDIIALNQVFLALRDGLAGFRSKAAGAQPVRKDLRKGDVRQSLADIGSAATLMGYEPTVMAGTGVKPTVEWYAQAVEKGFLATA
ncbi:hypothetical protein [Vulgatibacter incomptus]|uniref:Capsular polysaccharide biosynthesis protein WbpP n=1 Tax=Vulgatibacter incomptus TaxID=1391653 RepID=A0A0K1PHW8_9BACT|nr:hypothetical protein [Vulgatibacter incomptus]AKU93107.1 Capsular polysaccharide biosynthesis protein WbpP [Vulgatibacter incomptus]